MVAVVVGVNRADVEFGVAVVIFDTEVENVGATDVLDSEIRGNFGSLSSVSNGIFWHLE